LGEDVGLLITQSNFADLLTMTQQWRKYRSIYWKTLFSFMLRISIAP